jgi:hypothetical protein
MSVSSFLAWRGGTKLVRTVWQLGGQVAGLVNCSGQVDRWPMPCMARLKTNSCLAMAFFEYVYPETTSGPAPMHLPVLSCLNSP